MRRWLAIVVVVTAGFGPVPALAAVPANPAAPAGPQVASSTANGTQDNEDSYDARISGDGRWVAFASRADDLVPNRPVRAGVSNVYLKDRLTGSIQLITHASGGANNESYPLDVSADGRYVMFVSYATNLVENDTSGSAVEIFRWDRSVDANTLVSVDIPDTEFVSTWHSGYRGSMSDDGQFLVFDRTVGPYFDFRSQVYVRDMQRRTTERVSVNIDGDPGNGWSTRPAISGNGRYVAFASSATDLLGPEVPDEREPRYIYVRDLLFGITERVSLANGSGNDVYPTINEDGSIVAYMGNPGIWVWDMFTNSTVRADCGAAGWADGESRHPALNADGTVLAFESEATNLDPGGDANGVTDVFVTDPRSCAVTHRVSTAGRGCEPNGASYVGDLSADGTVVVFDSYATNLTRRDGTSEEDAFVGPTRSHQPTEESKC
jgi:Tol biopolymer transport system component